MPTLSYSLVQGGCPTGAACGAGMPRCGPALRGAHRRWQRAHDDRRLPPAIRFPRHRRWQHLQRHCRHRPGRQPGASSTTSWTWAPTRRRPLSRCTSARRARARWRSTRSRMSTSTARRSRSRRSRARLGPCGLERRPRRDGQPRHAGHHREQDDHRHVHPLTYSLHIGTAGQGAVEVDPQQDVYAYGTAVTLTAQADTGWTLAGWSGAFFAQANLVPNPITLTIAENTSITATFEALTYTLSLAADLPQGGTVSGAGCLHVRRTGRGRRRLHRAGSSSSGGRTARHRRCAVPLHADRRPRLDGAFPPGGGAFAPRAAARGHRRQVERQAS